ncbi:DNRLRE domain-containing protein [Planctomycetaceae bacterium SH139]
MARKNKAQKSIRKQMARRTLGRALRLQALENRQLLAFNVVDDVVSLGADATSLNVASNDTTGAEVQNVSAMQVSWSDLTTAFIPERPGTPGVAQRSTIPGAVTFVTSNQGDVDLSRDNDTDTSNDVATLGAADRLLRAEGVGLPVLRDNSPVNAAGTNLGVVQFRTDGATEEVWIAIGAAPENAGEASLPFSNAFFPYDAGWVGGAFNSSGGVNAGGAGMTVTGGGGIFEVEVAGVTDSFNDGFLFSVGGDNEDNYSRTRPIADGKWRVQLRDNAATLTGSESDDINLLYVPRDAQGLIGGTVNGGLSGVNPMEYMAGDFELQREADGLWRLSVPGHDITTGALILETRDLTVDEPRNAYFTYDDAGDGSGDILIRQFEWLASNQESPLNTDFMFYFVPFENTLNPANALTVTSVGTDADPSSGLSEKGLALVLNADGTVSYDTGGAILPLGGGQTDVDTFVYQITDGVDTQLGTVTINWQGENDTPFIVSPLADIVVDEDAPAEVIDLTPVFDDVDAGDVLSYSAVTSTDVFTVEVVGSDLIVTPLQDMYGFSAVEVTATDSGGKTVTDTFFVTVLPVDGDGVIAVDDSALTDKVTAINVDVELNDYHPDGSPFSVAAANVLGNPEATGNADTVWSVSGTTAGPNQLTIQSDPNLGDVAIGRNGLPLFKDDGVLFGTSQFDSAAHAASGLPADNFGRTVNAYSAFGSYGFATELGFSGNGERNTPVGTGFVPFSDGWVSGHVDSEGNLVDGIGVSPADVVKLGTGLFEITIPSAVSAGFDGLLFATGGNNDDNIVSVAPSSFENKWLVRQLDNDAAENGFEDDVWSFFYIPGTTPELLGGRYGGFEEDRGLKQVYGGVSVSEDFLTGNLTVTVPGFTPADGVLIAQTAAQEFVDGVPIEVPKNTVVTAAASGTDFLIETYGSGDWIGEASDAQFIFLPFAEPLERLSGLDFEITSFDATSTLGATITQNLDGTLNYDPSAAGAPISELGNGDSIVDTFTYTVTDGNGQTSTATVTVTVQGENQVPTANDDVINLNELSAPGALLTVLGNDTDPDLPIILGTPEYTTAANLAVDGSSVWSVAGTGAAPNAITLGATATGDVEVLRDGVAISPADGVVLATVRQNYDTAAENFRLVQAYENVGGGTSLALQQFGTDGAADAPVSLAYFPFADNWIAGHVDPAGNLINGSGLTAGEVSRTAAGRYEVTIPGVSDATTDGFLFVIGNENADNVVSSQAVAGSGVYQIAVRDNQQDFADGEDGGFSFVFVPRNSADLVAGAVDPFVDGANAVALGVGEFTVERLDVVDGGNEWKLTIPGQTPDSGILVLTNQNNSAVEDNVLTYEDDGAGSFLIRSHDMPAINLQTQSFSFMFIPFDGPGRPTPRPLNDPLSVQTVDATSALGATLTLNADNTISYDPGSIHDALYTGDTAVDTFSYTMTDGFGGSDTATVTVNISGFGEAPQIVFSADTAYYGIGDTPIGIDPSGDLVPIGVPLLDGGVLTLEITSGGNATDLLSIRNDGTDAGQIGVSGSDVTFGGTVIGTFVGGSGATALEITFNGDADEASVDALLRAIAYSNTDDQTSVGSREISASLVDANGRASDTVTKEVQLGLLRRRELQQGVDFGFGAYTGAQDAHLDEGNSNTVINPASDILIDFDNGGSNDQAVLKFENLFGNEPGQIPLGSVITSATLTLDTNPNTANAPGDGATFHRMLADWEDSTSTWNSFVNGLQKDDIEARSTFESALGTANGAGSSGTGELSISVLPDLRAWSAGEANFGWGIIGWDGNTDGWFFSTSENGEVTRRPRLQVEWLPAGADVVSFREGVDGYTGTVDTVIDSANPDLDNSLTETLFVDDPTTSVLLRFDEIIGGAANQVPAGATVISARLRTASTTGNAQGDGGTFHPMLETWTDLDTYNTLIDGVSPDGVEALETFRTQAGNETRNPNVQGGFHDWDVTADVQDWVNGVRGNNGWAILPWLNGTDGWGFQASEATIEAERPRLEIYWTETTNAAPTDILLDNSEVAENTDTTGGLAIGALSAVDPDAGDTHTFELVAGAGDADNSLFTINAGVLEINDGVTIDFENQSAYSVRVRATDAGGLVFERDLAISVIDRGEIESIVVADGTASRSRVETVTVSFDSEVTVDAGAFEVVKRGAGGGAVGVGFTTEVIDGKTVATLTFNGAFVANGSLVDGNYQLTVLGANITDALGNEFDGDEDGAVGGDRQFGEDEADDFFRFYGDIDGDRSVGFIDFLQFRGAFGSTDPEPEYREDLDSNADGEIDFVDFLQFRSRFGNDLAFE